MRARPGRETGPVGGGLAPRTADSGSALIMAIVVITVIGVAIGGALSYAGTSLKASAQAYKPARNQLYAADAAAKTALAYLQLNPSAGEAPADGSSCRPPLTYGTVGGAAVTVDICPNTSTSFAPTGGRPKYTLLALATGSETGLSVTSSGTFYVSGNVYSNTNIDSKGVVKVTGGDVTARTGCTGTITIDSGRVSNCSLTAQPADAVDPAYVPATLGAPAAATGSCDSTTKIATLNPGTWSSAAAIDAAIGSCSYVWMAPGVHYLDNFASNSPWTIRTKVVAGTLNGSIATSSIPGGCNATAAGAQIIMGGTSQILMGSGGSLQVCGIATTQSGSTIRVPLYGPTKDWVSSVVVPVNGTAATATASTFDVPGNGIVIDGTSATYTVPTGNGTSTLSVTNFAGVPTGVVLSVAVAASAASSSNLDEAVVVTSADGTTCTKPLTIATTMPTAGSATAVTLDCAGFNVVAPLKADLTLTNTKKSGSGNQVKVDGVELRYTTSSAAIKKQSGCITNGGCDVLSSNGTGRDVWLAGVVYVPQSSMNLKVPNSSTAVITQSLIVRSVSINATASAQTDPIVGSDQGTRSNGDVTVNANVGGLPWVSSRATFAVNGSVITPSLQSWVVRR